MGREYTPGTVPSEACPPMGSISRQDDTMPTINNKYARILFIINHCASDCKDNEFIGKFAV
jgi:hypothetical protein